MEDCGSAYAEAEAAAPHHQSPLHPPRHRQNLKPRLAAVEQPDHENERLAVAAGLAYLTILLQAEVFPRGVDGKGADELVVVLGFLWRNAGAVVEAAKVAHHAVEGEEAYQVDRTPAHLEVGVWVI